MFLLNLPILLYRLYRSLTVRGRTSLELELWAVENGMEVVVLKPCRRLPYSVEEQFPHRIMMGNVRYFQITTIDPDHVRRSGVARVHIETRSFFDAERVVDIVWLTDEQLNWQDRPPRRSAEMPQDRAEGWYTDHTGAHELRWYSVGTPTDLVKDGAIESRDPPGPPCPT
jgi:hypothetical protein